MFQWLDDGYGDVTALIASALPPLLWSLAELARSRRVDALSALIIATILFTVIATGLGGSARLIQIRDALVTGAVGIMFLISLAFPRPLIFYLARATLARNSTEGAARFETLWATPSVPGLFRRLTFVWGIGLVLQTAAMCKLALIWPIARYLLIAPPIGYGLITALMGWSFWHMAHHPAGKALRQALRP